MPREIDTLIQTELERFGVPNKCARRAPSGRHMRLIVKGKDREDYIPYSLGCAGRGLLNFRAEFRRFLYGLGFTPKSQEKVGTLGGAILEAALQSSSPAAEKVFIEICGTQTSPSPLVFHLAQPEASSPAPPALPAETKPKDKPMTSIETPSRSMLNQGEVAQVTMLISQHAKVDFEKKVCDYHPAWSDERIWRMLAVGERKHLTVDSVTKFRKSFFGNTPEENAQRKTAQGSGNFSAMWNAVRDLQARVEALEAATTDPDNKAANGARPSAHA